MIPRLAATLVIILAAVGFVACGAAPAPPAAAPPNIVAENAATGLAIADAVVNITPVNGAAYLTMLNRGDAPDRLLSVNSDVAGNVELHESVMDGNMMQMRPISGLDIAAGDTVRLEPGGYHIMLIDLTRELAAGDTIDLTLSFENSGEIVVPARVQQAGGMAHPEDDDHAGDDHAGDDHAAGAATPLSPASLAAGEKLKVVATTTIVGDLVRQVGGDAIELTVLLPVGSDPHSFEPSPQDIATASNGHALFVNGMGLERFLQRLVETAGGQIPVVSLADGISTREIGADGHDEGDDHGHDGVDPHIWVSPANALIMVENIEQALSALDPANAELFHANAERYAAELTELDAWVQTQIDTIPPENREMVTDHATFGYFADRYGLEMVGAVIPSFSTNAEPSAQEMARLQDAIASLGVKAVFVGVTVNPTLSEQIAADSGIKLIRLYTGSLGGPGSGAESYVDYIRANTNAIVEGLK
ncbi:MAG: hypothetical protein Kow0031_28110 [Anaerolineae bacterium]